MNILVVVIMCLVLCVPLLEGVVCFLCENCEVRPATKDICPGRYHCLSLTISVGGITVTTKKCGLCLDSSLPKMGCEDCKGDFCNFGKLHVNSLISTIVMVMMGIYGSHA